MDNTKQQSEHLDTEVTAKPAASTSNDYFSYESLEDHKELTRTIWGDEVKQDLFERWSQGFIFNYEKEPTALLQFSGGPCSIITAIQAFLLRELLFCSKCADNWRTLNEKELNEHLADAILSIFINVSSDNPKYLVFYNYKSNSTDKNIQNESLSNDDSSSNDQVKCSFNPKRAKQDYDAFTRRLSIFKFETLNELKVKLYENISEYKKDFGVLCFLYSLLLTKRLDLLKRELEESRESLIDPLHGHGSQSLTNLMLCGIATANVFDGEKCLEGLKLQGIPKQSTIGFLTIMEYLRYCEVGWNLKNPLSPIWILASETHLTVFFAQETSLISKNDSNRQIAIKKFQIYDPNENGFVKTEDLEKLMESLDLLTDKEYIDIVKQQLDNENLGIITQSAFLNEFYPQTEPSSIPNKFSVYHYNGLVRTGQDNDVQYSKGLAKLIDFDDQPSLDINSIKNCLQTKWPTIEVEWVDSKVPSLN